MRPTWDQYFMSIAAVVATRSHDAQTKVGCVIVKDNRIIGTGYNGFPPGMPDDKLPNTRPEKYKWVLHAEQNALSHCVIQPIGSVCYCTARPCLECTKSLYAAGIKTFVCGSQKVNMLDDPDQREVFEKIVEYGNINVRLMDQGPRILDTLGLDKEVKSQICEKLLNQKKTIIGIDM